MAAALAPSFAETPQALKGPDSPSAAYASHPELSPIYLLTYLKVHKNHAATAQGKRR